jgi:Tol biopolymer transport system component
MRLTTGENLQTPTSWSNANQLSYMDGGAAGNDIWVLPMAGGQPQAILKTAAAESSPAFSRDGRWLAYASTESGTNEVYVRPFPGPRRRHQVSTDGGGSPVWSKNGRELFYRLGDAMMAATITTEPVLTPPDHRGHFFGASTSRRIQVGPAMTSQPTGAS